MFKHNRFKLTSLLSIILIFMFALVSYAQTTLFGTNQGTTTAAVGSTGPSGYNLPAVPGTILTPSGFTTQMTTANTANQAAVTKKLATELGIKSSSSGTGGS